MLNEEKVKLMTKIAVYEKNRGEKDEAISSYYRTDYSSFHTILALIRFTIGYAIIVITGMVAFMEELFQHMSISFLVIFVAIIILGYFAILIFYGLVTYQLYNKKHAEARNRIKKYNQELSSLLRFYEKGE